MVGRTRAKAKKQNVNTEALGGPESVDRAYRFGRGTLCEADHDSASEPFKGETRETNFFPGLYFLSDNGFGRRIFADFQLLIGQEPTLGHHTK
jgi:hypothetical protein